MDNKHRKILKSNLPVLIEDLICSVSLMTVLEANGMLTNNMKKQVEVSNLKFN